MTKILVLNPNTSREMTESIKKIAKASVEPNTKVVVDHVKSAPESLESYYDYTLAAVGLIKYIKDLSKLPDGILIACFGDPGLFELKELLEIPVIGIAEASLAVAMLLGQNIGIIAASKKAVPMMWDTVRRYGLTERVKSIRALDMPVLELEKNPTKTSSRLREVIKEMKEEYIDVVILGCAGFTGLNKSVHEIAELEKIPIIEPVSVGTKILEILVRLKLKQSKIGIFQSPFPKRIPGFLSELFGGKLHE